ncbi:MAG: ASKHA domain-containing protein [Veillonellales bacterium]
MSEIIIHKKDKLITVRDFGNKSILEILNDQNLLLYAPCGGKGTCGKCRILVQGNTNQVTSIEIETLDKAELSRGIRLACQTVVYGQADVYLPDDYEENESKGNFLLHDAYSLNPLVCRKKVDLGAPTLAQGNSISKIIKTEVGNVKIGVPLMRQISQEIHFNQSAVCTLYDDELIDVEYGEDYESLYGVAVDIGTTTVVCYLMDLSTGIQLAAASRQNPQYTSGADVISRMHYTLGNSTGLEELSKKIIRTIDSLMEEVLVKAGIGSRSVYHCVLVGNTTMTHLFWGLNCKSLALLPFAPVTSEMLVETARTVGFKHMNGNGKVVFMPGIAGFVGADTVGAMIAADFKRVSRKIQLLLDLGTNGEIVLSTPQGKYACSTAAGPAFEGANIKYGMQAFAGAIDSVVIREDIFFHTIGNEAPRGVCGSGLIDAVSSFLRAGLINESGKIADAEQVSNERLAKRIVRTGRQKEIVIAEAGETAIGQSITLTQKDIRQLQLAKGAIRAGISILLQTAGLAFGDVDQVLLAGAFGNFVKKESAIRIGLIPLLALEKIISLGNGAGEGAKMALCDQEILRKVSRYFSENTHYVEISGHPDFQDSFINGMVFK